MEKRWNANDGFSVNIDVKEKKLRLFGFELDPCIQTNVDFGSDGRCQKKFEVAQEIEATRVVKFSNTEREKHDKERKGMADEVDDKKYECRFCYKEFANSQALGGHQNAHKKERQKKKRLELQAKKASINCYLQPYQSHGFNYERSTPSFYDPSYCVPEFTLFEESKGSFKLLDQNPYLNRLLVPKASALPSRVPIIQQNTCKENNPILIKSSSPLPIPKKSIKSLDLQLGLTVCNTSGSDL